MSRKAKLAVAACVLLAAVVSILAIARQSFPHEAMIRFTDPASEAHYRELLFQRGQTFHYAENARGEQEFVLESITDSQLVALRCDYLSWENPRLRARGVTVTENRECKP